MTRYCPWCGKPSPENWVFCSERCETKYGHKQLRGSKR
jgi:predicted nucleic acid-binding Zn ribbon protein